MEHDQFHCVITNLQKFRLTHPYTEQRDQLGTVVVLSQELLGILGPPLNTNMSEVVWFSTKVQIDTPMRRAA